MGTVRIKDHWAEQRLFERRAMAAAIIVISLTVVLIGRLVVIYWAIYAPHAGGIFAPWLAGLALDVFKGEVLGQNALAIALVAYIAMSFHQRLRNQTLIQQSLFVFAVLTLNEAVIWGIEGWSGHAVASAWRWIQPMIGAMLWPFVAMLVGRTHVRS